MAEIQVAPRLRCGVGNRLFQVMAAIGEAERSPNKAKPVFFLPRMAAEHGSFDLIFQLFPNIQTLETAPEWIEVKEDHMAQTQITQITHTLKVLSGFYQDLKYFPKEPTYLPKLPSTLPPNDSWAIHFRFGDYTHLPHYHVNLSKYYFYTITKIPKHSTLTLFSDSPERLPAIQKELENLEYNVQIFNNPDTLETMKAFASCVKGSVCSNSTFAWWCAWFSWNQAPKASQAPSQYTAYFPNQWIVGQPPPNLFATPFTQAICLEEISASPGLLSFSHS